MITTNDKLSNGYCAVLYYTDTVTPRIFGPMRTPAEAWRLLKEEIGIEAIVSNPQRPVLSRKYKVKPSMEGPSHVSFETLERWTLFRTPR